MSRRIPVIILVIVSMCSIGCERLLDTRLGKSLLLGLVVEQNLSRSPVIDEVLVSFTFCGLDGVYCVVTRDLRDGQTAGRFAYNLMVVLDERNNTLVRSDCDRFRIIGEQDGTVIFEVNYVTGSYKPVVTLKGPFEGEPWDPTQ